MGASMPKEELRDTHIVLGEITRCVQILKSRMALIQV
jgi:hypothetical protein